MKDWMIRALKTFAQAFLGVLIPAVTAMLNNGWPESVSAAWVILAPTVAAALAAAICAVWNIALEAMNNQQPIKTPKDEATPDWSKPPDTGNKTNSASIEFIERDFLRHGDDGKD